MTNFVSPEVASSAGKMQEMDLTAHIHRILLSQGTVEVPGLGCFVSVRHGATRSGDTMSPPRTEVEYEPSQTGDGDALIASVMRTDLLDEEAARRAVSHAVGTLRATLARTGTCDLPDVGVMKLRGNGTISFRSTDTYATDSWATDVVLQPVAEAEEESRGAVINPITMHPSLLRQLQRTASGAAAIAIFALLAFVLAQLPGARIPRQLATFATAAVATAGTEEDAPILTDIAAQSEPTLVLVLNTPADGTAPAKVRYRRSEISRDADSWRYCMVIASLATRAEADKYMTLHSTTDIPLHLLEMDGRYRVYTHTGATAQEVAAAATAAGIADRFPSMWVCRR